MNSIKARRKAWRTIIQTALAIGALLACLADGQAQELKGKKVFYINSYHAGYAWSDDVQRAIQEVLKPAGVELKTAFLDNYRQKSEEDLAKASAACRDTIEQWRPDVVIVSDDPAMKGVFVPFYQGKQAPPFVFCGVNWDATIYGAPAKNITGMLEVCPVKDLLAEMGKLKSGQRLGYLSSDSLTPKKDLENCAKILGVTIEKVFAKDFKEWKQGFQDLQSKVDLLILGVNLGLADWDEAEARKFVEQNTKIVTGSWHDYLNALALVSYNKSAAEQGEWAARAALQILKGAAPSTIPVATNQKGELVINARIAKKAGITPPFEMIQDAKVLE